MQTTRSIVAPYPTMRPPYALAFRLPFRPCGPRDYEPGTSDDNPADAQAFYDAKLPDHNFGRLREHPSDSDGIS